MDIGRKLDTISSVLDVDRLLSEDNSDEQIIDYYIKNRLPYRLFHNRKGYMHMGISYDGKHKDTDLEESLRQIDKVIASLGTSARVLELASGQGMNTAYLAKNNPDKEFHAIDLSTEPRSTFFRANTTFSFGDFHDLSMYQTESFDLVFIVEALCYSRDRSKVFAEVSRILKPGGFFIIFDGYHKRDLDSLTADEYKAARLVSVGMMVDEFAQYQDIPRLAKVHEFKITEAKDLSKEIMPSAKRFERLADLFFRYRMLNIIGKKVLAEKTIRNSLAAYLMVDLLEKGIAAYFKHVLEKPR